MPPNITSLLNNTLGDNEPTDVVLPLLKIAWGLSKENDPTIHSHLFISQLYRLLSSQTHSPVVRLYSVRLLNKLMVSEDFQEATIESDGLAGILQQLRYYKDFPNSNTVVHLGILRGVVRILPYLLASRILLLSFRQFGGISYLCSTASSLIDSLVEFGSQDGEMQEISVLKDTMKALELSMEGIDSNELLRQTGEVPLWDTLVLLLHKGLKSLINIYGTMCHPGRKGSREILITLFHMVTTFLRTVNVTSPLTLSMLEERNMKKISLGGITVSSRTLLNGTLEAIAKYLKPRITVGDEKDLSPIEEGKEEEYSNAISLELQISVVVAESFYISTMNGLIDLHHFQKHILKHILDVVYKIISQFHSIGLIWGAEEGIEALTVDEGDEENDKDNDNYEGGEREVGKDEHKDKRDDDGSLYVRRHRRILLLYLLIILKLMDEYGTGDVQPDDSARERLIGKLLKSHYFDKIIETLSKLLKHILEEGSSFDKNRETIGNGIEKSLREQLDAFVEAVHSFLLNRLVTMTGLGILLPRDFSVFIHHFPFSLLCVCFMTVHAALKEERSRSHCFSTVSGDLEKEERKRKREKSPCFVSLLERIITCAFSFWSEAGIEDGTHSKLVDPFTASLSLSLLFELLNSNKYDMGNYRYKIHAGLGIELGTTFEAIEGKSYLANAEESEEDEDSRTLDVSSDKEQHNGKAREEMMEPMLPVKVRSLISNFILHRCRDKLLKGIVGLLNLKESSKALKKGGDFRVLKSVVSALSLEVNYVGKGGNGHKLPRCEIPNEGTAPKNRILPLEFTVSVLLQLGCAGVVMGIVRNATDLKDLEELGRLMKGEPSKYIHRRWLKMLIAGRNNPHSPGERHLVDSILSAARGAMEKTKMHIQPTAPDIPQNEEKPRRNYSRMGISRAVSPPSAVETSSTTTPTNRKLSSRGGRATSRITMYSTEERRMEKLPDISAGPSSSLSLFPPPPLPSSPRTFLAPQQQQQLTSRMEQRDNIFGLEEVNNKSMTQTADPSQINDLLKQVKKLLDRNSHLEDKLKKERGKVEAFQGKEEVRIERDSKLNKTLETLTQQCKELKDDKEKLRRELEKSREEIEQLREREGATLVAMTQLRDRTEEAQNVRMQSDTRYRLKVEKMFTKLEQLMIETKQLDDELVMKEERQGSLEAQMRQNIQIVAELTERLNLKDHTVAENTLKSEGALRRATELESELASFRVRHKQKTARMKKTINDNEKQLREMNISLTEAECKAEEYSNVISELNNKLGRRKEKLNKLRQEKTPRRESFLSRSLDEFPSILEFDALKGENERLRRLMEGLRAHLETREDDKDVERYSKLFSLPPANTRGGKRRIPSPKATRDYSNHALGCMDPTKMDEIITGEIEWGSLSILVSKIQECYRLLKEKEERKRKYVDLQDVKDGEGEEENDNDNNNEKEKQGAGNGNNEDDENNHIIALVHGNESYIHDTRSQEDKNKKGESQESTLLGKFDFVIKSLADTRLVRLLGNIGEEGENVTAEEENADHKDGVDVEQEQEQEESLFNKNDFAILYNSALCLLHESTDPSLLSNPAKMQGIQTNIIIALSLLFKYATDPDRLCEILLLVANQEILISNDALAHPLYRLLERSIKGTNYNRNILSVISSAMCNWNETSIFRLKRGLHILEKVSEVSKWKEDKNKKNKKKKGEEEEEEESDDGSSNNSNEYDYDENSSSSSSLSSIPIILDDTIVGAISVAYGKAGALGYKRLEKKIARSVILSASSAVKRRHKRQLLESRLLDYLANIDLDEEKLFEATVHLLLMLNDEEIFFSVSLGILRRLVLKMSTFTTSSETLVDFYLLVAKLTHIPLSGERLEIVLPPEFSGDGKDIQPPYISLQRAITCLECVDALKQVFMGSWDGLGAKFPLPPKHKGSWLLTLACYSLGILAFILSQAPSLSATLRSDIPFLKTITIVSRQGGDTELGTLASRVVLCL